jgi:hypothetical protein
MLATGTCTFLDPHRAAEVKYSAGFLTSFIKILSALGSCGGFRFTMDGVPHSPSLSFFPLRYALIPEFSAFEYTYLLWWNSFWTIAPVIAIGVFDRLVGASWFHLQET